MKKVNILLAILFLIQLSTALAAKPTPPEKLTGLFVGVVEIEDAIGSADWKRAQDLASELEEALTGLGLSIRSAAGDQVYTAILSEITKLRTAAAQQDRVNTEMGLIALQKWVLQAMDAYDYPVHPVFKVINQYVAEAGEAIEKNDYSRVIHEMKEVANFVSASADTIAQKGIGKGLMSDFQIQLFAVLDAANIKDKNRVLSSLKNIKSTSGAFAWIASRQ